MIPVYSQVLLGVLSAYYIRDIGSNKGATHETEKSYVGIVASRQSLKSRLSCQNRVLEVRSVVSSNADAHPHLSSFYALRHD